MLLCLHYLRTAYEKLLNIQDKLESEVKITNRKKAEGKEREFDGKIITLTVNNLFLDIAMVIEESREMDIYRSDYFIRARRQQQDIANRLENVTTAEDLLSIVKDIINVLTLAMTDKIYDNTTYYDYSYDFKNKWGDYTADEDSMDQTVIRKISGAIKPTQRIINVFEMFVRNERLVTAFKNLTNSKQKDNVDFYGLDTNNNAHRGSIRSCFKRLIYGRIKGSVITNGCFDIVLCAPPISVNKEIVGGQFVKRERELLIKTVDYLRQGGLLVFAIPYYRFATEICGFLVKNYDNLQIFSDGHSKLAYVIGTRRDIAIPIANVRTQEYFTLRNLPLHFSELPILPDLEPIELQSQSLEVKRFRGSQLNEAELVEMYHTSKSTADFWKGQKTEKLEESQAHPLLPFTIGQLGLILTSGCLDGIVDEGNGCYHAVKGRVVKKTETTENVDIENHQIFTTNITTNRVEISVLLPDGTYKLLT